MILKRLISSINNKRRLNLIARAIFICNIRSKIVMTEKSLLLILGNQLFPVESIQRPGTNFVFMAEDLGLCTYEKHHKLKILMFLAAMREKRDELLAADCMVEYLEISMRLLVRPMKKS